MLSRVRAIDCLQLSYTSGNLMTSDVGNVGQEPSAEDIEFALSKTGFLLEHRVAKLLRNHRLKPEVTIGDAYPDPETGKSREIDVYADFYEFVERAPSVSVQISVALVIECKNNSGPFVVIGDRGIESPHFDDFAAISFDPITLGFPNAKYHSLEYEIGLSGIPGLPGGRNFTGRQLLRLNRQGGGWRADNNAIYDSILYPLAKAKQYQMGYFEREKDESPEECWQNPGIRFTLPIIVTSGPLYVVDATDDNLNIYPAKWASIKRAFGSKELKGNFWADLVSFADWNDYMDAKVVKLFAGAQDLIAKNLHFYDPEWLAANLGEPLGEEFFEEWLKYYQAQRKLKNSRLTLAAGVRPPH
jgi:hypothetical protein